MRAELITFGVIEVEGQRYDYDVVVDQGVVRKRHKKASRPYRERYGHTPLSVEEDIPWSGRRLVIGTGASGQLPVMDELLVEARRRGVEVITRPTREACDLLAEMPSGQVCAVLHVTC